DNIELSKTSGRISQSSIARFSSIAEGELGQVFSSEGVDIAQALKEKAIILFILNPLTFPELSPAFGRLVLIDAKKAIGSLFKANMGKSLTSDDMSTGNPIMSSSEKSTMSSTDESFLSDIDTPSNEHSNKSMSSSTNESLLSDIDNNTGALHKNKSLMMDTPYNNDMNNPISPTTNESTIQRTFFILDEINVYATTALTDLVNKSRSAGVTCILATQSLSDLDAACGEAYKEQIIENCNNYILMRQNSGVNAEKWANIIGTRSTMDVTYQLQQRGLETSETGFGSARRVREYLYHPDDIKTLQTGKGVYLSRDTNFYSKVSVNKEF
ncbi:MAG: TraG/TraD/VirD4 family protein, partial [Oscillospiraceae bacterium]|nr:TraG/TraD/VirD4 family protein [Oscillospiraceae bacterium]